MKKRIWLLFLSLFCLTACTTSETTEKTTEENTVSDTETTSQQDGTAFGMRVYGSLLQHQTHP